MAGKMMKGGAVEKSETPQQEARSHSPAFLQKSARLATRKPVAGRKSGR